MAFQLKPIFIQRDKREKENKGWFFDLEEKESGKVQILGTIEESLPGGDYCVQNYSDLCVVERKQNFAELFNNLMNKDGRIRFENELEKLRKVKHKYIIIESSLNSDMMGMTLPQYKFAGPPVSKITNMLFEYELEYDIHPIFADCCGKKIASQIFKNIARKYL